MMIASSGQSPIAEGIANFERDRSYDGIEIDCVLAYWRNYEDGISSYIPNYRTMTVGGHTSLNTIYLSPHSRPIVISHQEKNTTIYRFGDTATHSACAYAQGGGLRQF